MFLGICLPVVAQINAPEKNNVELQNNTKGREEVLDSTKFSDPTGYGGVSKKKEQKISYQSVKQKYDSSYDSYTMNPARRSMTEGEKNELTVYLDQMSKLEPENWLNFLAYYQIGQHDISRYPALEKVESQKMKDKDLLNQVISYDAITSNENRLREDLVQLKKTTFYSAETFSYAEDVLMSCDDNSILITHGFEDTHTALYVQKVMRKKKDVEIIDLDWLNSSFYRTVLEGKGYKIPTGNMIDVAFLKDFCVLNSSRQIHLALTLAQPYLNSVLTNIYVQGLTFRYSPFSLELSMKNQLLWDGVLTKTILTDCKSRLSVNYLPLLYQLRQTTAVATTESYSSKKSNSVDTQLYDQLIQRIIQVQNLPTSLNK